MNEQEMTVRLPAWVYEYVGGEPVELSALEDRMRFVIGLAWENVERWTGGPFGAAIFDAAGNLVAPGVNMVIPQNCSVLHAEMVAMMLAQKRLGRFDISDGGQFRCELVTSVEPCAMCFGAVPFSGVARLICGAREEDARGIGFDEGPKPADWPQTLDDRNIEVVRDVLREQAAAVLKRYLAIGGPIYNAGG